MTGLLDLMFGSGANKLLGSSESEESKYAVKEANDESHRKELEVQDAEYREVEKPKSLNEKMFGKSFAKRTPEEEKAVQAAKQRDELKKERKRQAEREEEAKAKKAYDEAVVKEKATRKARRVVRHAARMSRVKPFTVQDYSGVYIPAFGQVRSTKSSPHVSYSKHGVYPYDLVQVGVNNLNIGNTSTRHTPGTHGLSNPLFTSFFSGNGKQSNGKHKGVHPWASFGFI
jgi:hypothetical protein